jgi:deazaflavin-dependent oxidoreductase (nitroreductase family)
MAVARRRRAQRLLEKWILNPPARVLLTLGLAPRFFVLLETTGRRTGKRRRTPVGGDLDGSVFWLVSEKGESAAYVRNLAERPRIRIRIGRRWRTGTATVLADDDAWARREEINRANGAVGRFDGAFFRWGARRVGGEPVTVRIDVDEID